MISSWKERLKEQLETVDMFSLEKRRPWGDMVVIFKYLKGFHMLSARVISEHKTKDENFKLQGTSFQLNIKKLFLTIRTL